MLESVTEPLKMAIVGSGVAAMKCHLPAALACAGVELVALVDPVEDRASQLIHRFALKARTAPSLDDVLDDIDAAVIATPNSTHSELSIQCLQNKVHVLIEKPLATSVAEGENIVQAVQKYGAVAAVGYNRRFLSSVKLLKRLLDERFFGTVHRFVYQFGTRGGWSPLSGYNLDLGTSGGGVLIANGVHFLDRMIYCFGYPTSWNYQDDSRGGPEATAVCQFRFEGEQETIHGEVRFSKTVVLKEGFVMETERGIVCMRGDETSLVFRPKAQSFMEERLADHSERPVAHRETHLRQMEDFVDACRHARQPRVTVQQGQLTQRLIEALYKSREDLPGTFVVKLPANRSAGSRSSQGTIT